jgi:hypothetical protein
MNSFRSSQVEGLELRLDSEPNTYTDPMKVKLSTLWIFAMFNYLYADVIGLMKAENLQAFITGYAGSMKITEGFLLGAAILMETAIAMVLLSRTLGYRANRWANIIVGLLHTVSVSASMFIGSGPGLYYMLFGAIEVICTIYIIWSAWRWTNLLTDITGGI